MKRITGVLLSLAILISVLAVGLVPASAGSNMSASDELIRILKLEEGFCQYPVSDYGQYTVGYGTRCPAEMVEYYTKNGITTQEAELLLRNYLQNIEYRINTHLIDRYSLNMTQGQFDALVAFSFNMGASWTNDTSQNIHQKVAAGATGNDIIEALGRWCRAGGQVKSFLIRRRMSEANMYLNGIYSKTPPENYCYVTYNGNGGSISFTAQCYDAELTATPNCVSTFGEYTFEGWYTELVGGEKVEVLTAEHDGMTLYAHWTEIEQGYDECEPFTVTVTVKNLNLRKGPGTNYSRVGTGYMGDEYTITQIIKNGGYTWGFYGEGWIALDYTDYDESEVVRPTDPESTEPETTDPDTTEPETSEGDTTEPETTEGETTEPVATDPESSDPETTEPETTEPDTTEPPTTEPPTTEPPTTVPETTEPENTVIATGTVKANPHLRVRSGPSTGYGVVKVLDNGTKVSIYEKKAVGSSVWARVDGGWISLSYVVLDETSSTQPPVVNSQTGTVTCNILNVRSGPGTNYGLVDQYRKGATVTITETKTVGSTTWGKTDKGWVSMNYIKITQTSTGGNTGSTEEPEKITGKVISNDVLRIRSGPGTSYTIVGYLKPGQTLTITETKTVGSTTWGKTEKGWVSMDYVEITSGGTSEEDPGEEEPVVVTKTVSVSCLIIRKGAGTSNEIAGYLYRGAKVQITEIKIVGEQQWGKIANGWICMEYVK